MAVDMVLSIGSCGVAALRIDGRVPSWLPDASSRDRVSGGGYPEKTRDRARLLQAACRPAFTGGGEGVTAALPVLPT